MVPHNIQVFFGGTSVVGGAGTAALVSYYCAMTGTAIASLATCGVFVVAGACAVAYKMNWKAEEKIEFVKKTMVDEYDQKQKFKILTELQTIYDGMCVDCEKHNQFL